jgi:hypothetical protein
MQGTDVLEELIDPKTLKILRIFFDDDKRPFYLREISKITGVALASTFRIVNHLFNLKILEQVSLAKFKVYRLADNERTRFLGQLVKKQKQILQIFVSRVKHVEGIEEVVLVGKEEKNMATIIIIGNNLDTTGIFEINNQIFGEFNYKINYIPMNREQYNLMNAVPNMGISKETKRSLFKK